jgi:uncharacterized membrane protein
MQVVILRYVSVLFVLAVGDALWLSWFAHAMFRPVLGDILLATPRWSAVVLFYLIYALGVSVFPVATGLRIGSLASAVGYGALFGFLAYMTYDLTNLATIKAWTILLALIDVFWGTVLTAGATGAAYVVTQRF